MQLFGISVGGRVAILWNNTPSTRTKVGTIYYCWREERYEEAKKQLWWTFSVQKNFTGWFGKQNLLFPSP